MTASATGSTYRIGRGQGNDIVLEDASVSRQHAEVRAEPAGDYLLTDLDSTNGTCVREGNRWVEIERASVSADERILIGDVVTTVGALLARLQPPGAAPQADGDAALRRVRTEPSIRVPEADDGAAPVGQRRSLSRRVGAGPIFTDERPNHAQLIGQRPGERFRRELAPARPVLENRIGHKQEDFDTGDIRLVNPAPVDEGASILLPGGVAARPSGDDAPACPSLMIEPRRREAVPAIEPVAGKQPRGPARAKRRLLMTAAMGAILMLSAAVGGALALYGDGVRVPGATPAKEPVTAKAKPSPAASKPAPSLPKEAGHWRAIAGDADVDMFASAVPAKGGESLAVGSTLSRSAGRFDLWAARFSADGRLLWERRFGAKDDDYGMAAVTDGQNGVVAAGAADGRRQLWFVAIDAKGSLRWARRLPLDGTGHATTIDALRNPAKNGYVAAAVVQGKADARAQAAVIRLGADGAVLWRKDFAGPYTWPSDIHALRDGGFVVAGVQRDPATGRNAVWLLRLDRDGTKLWEKRVTGAGIDGPAYVRSARRSELIVATTQTIPGDDAKAPPKAVNVRLLRFDRDGAQIWDYVHSTPSADRVAGLRLVKGGILVAGSRTEANGKPSAWLARFNAKGGLDWQTRPLGAEKSSLTGIALTRNGLLISGAWEHDGAKRQGIVLHVDRSGRLPRAAN